MEEKFVVGMDLIPLLQIGIYNILFLFPDEIQNDSNEEIELRKLTLSFTPNFALGWFVYEAEGIRKFFCNIKSIPFINCSRSSGAISKRGRKNQFGFVSTM